MPVGNGFVNVNSDSLTRCNESRINELRSRREPFRARGGPACYFRAKLRGLDRGAFVGREYVFDRGAEFVQPRARHNNRVPPAMRFFSNAKEFAPIVLAEFHVKVFPLDLDLFRFDDVIHVRGSILGRFGGAWEAKFA